MSWGERVGEGRSGRAGRELEKKQDGAREEDNVFHE